MRPFFSIVFLSFLSFCFVPLCHAKEEIHVGYRSISTWNARENIRLDVGIWYPSRVEERDYVMDEYHMYVAKNAPVFRVVDEKNSQSALKKHEEIRAYAKKNNLQRKELQAQLDAVPLTYKRFPLLIISHASGLTRYSYHTLAELLVKQGYIVAVPMHSEDNAHNMRIFYSAKSFYQRAKQCSLAIDLLLQDKTFSQFMDNTKISYMGFGSGGAAGLLLTGAELTADRWQTYCDGYENNNAENNNLWAFDITNLKTNLFCQEPVKTQVEQFSAGLQRSIEITNQEQAFFDNAFASKKEVLEKVHKILEFQVRWSKRNNPGLSAYVYEPPFLVPYLPPLQTQSTYADTRFKNFIFVSPALTMFFDIKKIQNASLKFCIIGLEKDYFNVPDIQPRDLYEQLGSERAKYYLLKDADLWATQAPCYGINMLVEICKSVSDDEREQILKRLFNIVYSFIPHFK